MTINDYIDAVAWHQAGWHRYAEARVAALADDVAALRAETDALREQSDALLAGAKDVREMAEKVLETHS